MFNLKIHAKKGKKHYQFQNSYKNEKGQEGKQKAQFLYYFCFYTRCAFFCIFNLKIHAKKKDKNGKKGKQNFSNSKNIIFCPPVGS